MGLGNQTRTAGQNEVLQRPQFLIPAIDRGFKPFDLSRVECLIFRHRQFAPQVKQAVLTGLKHFDQLIEPWLAGTVLDEPGQEQADLTVKRIDFADGFYARVILGNAAAVAKPCFALVAGAGVNFR